MSPFPSQIQNLENLKTINWALIIQKEVIINEIIVFPFKNALSYLNTSSKMPKS